MDLTTLGGQLLGIIPLGDIVLYVTTFNLFMSVAALVFTVLIAMSRTEKQVEAQFGTLNDREKRLVSDEI